MLCDNNEIGSSDNTETGSSLKIKEENNNGDTKDEELDAEPKPVTQRAKVQYIIDQGGVKHVPEMECFIVEGLGDKYLVHLFPKQKCTCPLTNECSHIKSVKRTLGMKPNYTDGSCMGTAVKQQIRNPVQRGLVPKIMIILLLLTLFIINQ